MTDRIFKSLPAGGLPPAPTGESSGGVGLPLLKGEGDASPVFTSATDLTWPNETVSLTGEDLQEAAALIWTEGCLRRVEPLRSDSTKMQVVIPPDRKRSVTLLWPVKNDRIGAPVRINAPEIFWCDRETICREESPCRIRFFGTGLTVDGEVPTVFCRFDDGQTESAAVLGRSPYDLTAEIRRIPPDSRSCEIFLHNGTGGACGWSEAVTLAVGSRTTREEAELPLLSVDEFGAVPDSGRDCAEAIGRAVAAAASLGGAVIAFGPGEYLISETVEIRGAFPNGLVLRGRGMGVYDMKSSLRPSEYEYRGLSGDYTAIRFLDPRSAPPSLFRVVGENVTIRDMTLYGADGHVSGYTMKYGYTLWAGGKNLRFERLRMIKADLRDFDTEKRSDLLCSNQLYIDTASRFVTVEGCRFHQKACAVWINFYDGPRYAQPILFEDDRQVRFVTIRGCDFYGYTFSYVHPDGRRPRGDEGEISRGITAMNVENMIVENCRFIGRDQKHDQVLTRSMYIPITANRMFIADNLMLNVGSTPGTGFDGNTGEQILLHGGLHLGGVYNVKQCEGDRLTVRRDNIVLYDESGRLISPEDTVTNAGSIVTDGLKRGRRGMAYIAAGRGVGQIRQIDGYEEAPDAYVFLLHRPFTVEPDETSVIVETAPFRENLIVRNTIMKETPTYSHGFKSGGVLLFFDSYRNVIAENDFRHLAFGVSLNAAFKCPVLMNTVRDNRFTGIREAYYDAMQGGDSTRNATCFCESVVGNAGEQAGWDDYTVWYTQGNVFRSNRCFDCDSAAEIATNRWNNLRNAGIDRYFGEEKGACMTVIENNSFRSVAQGILVGNPAYWPLIRNNGFRFSEKPGFLSDKIRYDQNPMNYRLMQIEGDAVIADECRTVNPRLSGFERSARRQAHPGSDAGGHVIPAALAYIEAHFTEPIKLDDLAAACFVNKYYLSHLFTRTVGCSIGVYITEKRLKQVCALLVQTKLPVVDLGRKCGFNDPAYLGKIFKARFGVTPSRYRRLHTDGGESPESEKPGGARS